MSTPCCDHAGETPIWHASAIARFWEPGVEDWTRRKLHLPDRSRVTAVEFDLAKVAPHTEKRIAEHANRLVLVGIAALWNQAKNGTRAWSPASGGANGFTGMGVGNSATPDTDADVDLLATGSNKSYRVCDNTFPLINGATNPANSAVVTQRQMVFQATFASAEANFDWNEYCVIVGGSGADAAPATATNVKPTAYTILNRKGGAGLGPKASGSPASINLGITITSAA